MRKNNLIYIYINRIRVLLKWPNLAFKREFVIKTLKSLEHYRLVYILDSND